MSAKKTSKRTYDSSRRKEQARQTRRQIIEAARKLFIERGYSGATMEAIAQEAGVAAETIYAAFGNKQGILSRLISVSLVGDDEPATLFEREGPLAVQQEKDPARQIKLFAADMAQIMGRVAPILEVMRSAAKIEPEIDEMFHTLLNERVEGMKFFIHALAANSPLRAGLTIEAAAETVWALTSGEVYTLLVKDRGWPVDKYCSWLATAFSQLLLPSN